LRISFSALSASRNTRLELVVGAAAADDDVLAQACAFSLPEGRIQLPGVGPGAPIKSMIYPIA
jgi:hypothetical protein